MKHHRMGTLFITEAYPPARGGVSRSSRRIVEALIMQAIPVVVFTLDRSLPAGMTSWKEQDGVTVVRLGPFPEDDLTLQLSGNIITELVHTYPVEILHGFYALYPGYLAAFYARMLGRKSIVNARGNDVDRGMFHSRYSHFLQWTLSKADAITCVTGEMVRKCTVLSGRKDIFYTPNSVNAQVFKALPDSAMLRKKHFLGNEFVVAFSGELRMKKGITFILDAFRDLSLSDDFRLLIIGNIRKSDLPIFERYVKEHGESEKKLIITGHISDDEKLCEYYNMSDLVISPSLWEGMPNSVLEAMACERVVLSSDAGGAADIITHGIDGFMIRRGELHYLKDAIERIVKKTPEEREKIGKCARERVITHFDKEREIAKLMLVYEAALTGSLRSPVY
ncbi:MAG: glycosyltransferase family 4 protein [Candidatus Xenobiia bacterium LiM19]